MKETNRIVLFLMFTALIFITIMFAASLASSFPAVIAILILPIVVLIVVGFYYFMTQHKRTRTVIWVLLGLMTLFATIIIILVSKGLMEFTILNLTE